jgi:hypothetical protein
MSSNVVDSYIDVMLYPLPVEQKEYSNLSWK